MFFAIAEERVGNGNGTLLNVFILIPKIRSKGKVFPSKQNCFCDNGSDHTNEECCFLMTWQRAYSKFEKQICRYKSWTYGTRDRHYCYFFFPFRSRSLLRSLIPSLLGFSSSHNGVAATQDKGVFLGKGIFWMWTFASFKGTIIPETGNHNKQYGYGASDQSSSWQTEQNRHWLWLWTVRLTHRTGEHFLMQIITPIS